MNRIFSINRRFAFFAILLSIGIASTPAEVKSHPKAAKEKLVVAPANPADNLPAPKSTFTIGKNFKDPFFPKSNKSVASNTASSASPATPADVQSALRAGFQGVLGAGDQRLAIINNVILENGRTTTVPVRLGSSEQRVGVRVVEVLKNGVVIEIQGQKQPLTITRAESR